MCEFKVLLRELAGLSKIAEDVVKTKYNNQRLILMDVTGNSKSVTGAIITDVDVLNEELRLIKHPLIAPFLELIHAHLEGEKPENLKEMWERLKREGDKIFHYSK